MRPIDADALIEKCGGWYVDECTESGFIGTLENLLATEPTIQPQSTTGQLNDGTQSTARSTDLIGRQAAIDAINSWRGRFSEEYNEAIDDCENSIKELPIIQPEPQEGYWIRRDCGLDVECKCSKCGYRDFVEPGDEYWFKRNYCPNCGAKMRGEQHETD